MGLDVVVGVYGEFDEQECQEFADDFAMLRRELTVAGLPDWEEPEVGEDDVVVHDMYGHSGLHHLRRLAAHLAASGTIPEPADQSPELDPVLKTAYAHGPTRAVVVKDGVVEYVESTLRGQSFDHLIQHSDREGYYVPAYFAPVLRSDDVLGHYVGSSQHLLEECLRVAEALGLPIDLDPDSKEVADAVHGRVEQPAKWQRHGIASLTCLQLINAAWQSIKIGAVIAFC